MSHSTNKPVGDVREANNIGTVNKYDYTNLNEETRQFVLERVEKIKILMQRTSRDIIDIGTYLLEVKEKLQHGQFQNWLEEEFQWSLSLAAKFMQVAREFKSISITDLNITPTALYVLAQPSMMPEVREKAIERAKSGEEITPKKVTQIREALEPKSEPSENKEANIIERRRSRKKELAQKENKSLLAPTENQELMEKSPLFLSKPEIITVRPPQNWHQLGKHLLYHGFPAAEDFRRRLPKEIALLIDFSVKENQSLDNIKSQVFLGISHDFDGSKLESSTYSVIVREMLEIHTQTDEYVVFCLLPSPNFLLKADFLGCKCFVAEPDWKRCEQTMKIWNEAKIIG